MAHKLAECLLRRKELQQQLDRMGQINQRELFDVRVKRQNISESVDEVTAAVPKVTFAEFDQEYRYYAKQLRLIDAAIQQVNWTAEVSLEHDCFTDYVPPEKK